MLYKRTFRKEKEVVTLLIKYRMAKLAWNLRIEPPPYQSEATERALAKGQVVCFFPIGRHCLRHTSCSFGAVPRKLLTAGVTTAFGDEFTLQIGGHEHG